MSENHAESSGLGHLGCFPLEVRQMIYKHYFAHATSTVYMPNGNYIMYEDHFTYHIQNSDRQLLLTSRSVHKEAASYCAPTLILNNTDFLLSGCYVPEMLRVKANVLVCQLQSHDKQFRFAPEPLVRAYLPDCKRVELRIIVPFDLGARISEHYPFAMFMQDVERGLYNREIRHTLWDITLDWNWKYCVGHKWRNTDDIFENTPCDELCRTTSEELRLESDLRLKSDLQVVVDFECWISPTVEVRDGRDQVKALHAVIELQTGVVIEWYLVERPSTDDDDKIFESFGGRHKNENPWHQVEYGRMDCPWADWSNLTNLTITRNMRQSWHLDHAADALLH